jgi:hypothetical protein
MRRPTQDGYQLLPDSAPNRMPCGTVFSLTHFERYAWHMVPGKIFEGTIMADRSGLKLVGFIFATVTLAVMLTAAMIVKGYADGSLSLDAAPIESR